MWHHDEIWYLAGGSSTSWEDSSWICYQKLDIYIYTWDQTIKPNSLACFWTLNVNNIGLSKKPDSPRTSRKSHIFHVQAYSGFTLWMSEPLPWRSESGVALSMNFLALSQAPPVFDMEIATCTPEAIPPTGRGQMTRISQQQLSENA